MRTLILGVIASALLWANKEDVYDTSLDIIDNVWITWTAEDTRTDRSLQGMRYRVWLDLCMDYRAEADCQGILVPKIKTFRPNPLRPGLAGYYKGGDVVYVRSNLKYIEREEVLAHEMSHYLDVELGLANVPGFAREICFSEKRAWRVSDLFWQRQGYAEDSRKMVGSRWTNWYSHCKPLQSELYPDEFPAS